MKSPTLRFRTQVFLAAFGAMAIAVGLVALLESSSVRAQIRDRIERTLVTQARMAAEVLAHHAQIAPGEIDDEADTIGGMLDARVTFIAADGTVVGDSAEDGADLAALENHGRRPEVVAARQSGLGVAQRHSATLGVDMLYVAVPARGPEVAIVRLALPLTEVDHQLAVVRRVSLIALGTGLVVALALSWFASLLLSRRLTAIAAVARRYAAGDLSRPSYDYGSDEIGTVARVLDQSVQELGRRMSELASDRARMEAILTGMVEGVMVVDDQGRVQLLNEAARRMLALEDADTGVGRPFLEIIRHPDIAAGIDAALAGRAAQGQEFTLQRDPGRTFVARAAPVAAPAARGAVLVLHDITDLRRADQIRRDFVANVSHELRTPLTAIRGYVETLMDGPADPEANRRFLEIIARHSHRMERLVKDLLRLARIDAGQETLDLSECSIEAVVGGVLTELTPVITSRRQTVHTDAQPGTATVTGDPAKLHDILRNLIENAVSYAPEGTTVVVGSRLDNDRLVITVADEGPGIPEAELTRIFERFYRVDRARSREAGGTGLGLSIVKNLVGLLGGAVSAANRPEGGAIFTVTLPGKS
jgi:two-component system phosphate regulon sensor histidine kinase PhoR